MERREYYSNLLDKAADLKSIKVGFQPPATQKDTNSAQDPISCKCKPVLLRLSTKPWKVLPLLQLTAYLHLQVVIHYPEIILENETDIVHT